MKEIIVNDNLVFLEDGRIYQVDCSTLSANSIRYVGYDSEGVFVEKIPFKGQQRPKNTTDIDNIFNEAIALQIEEDKPIEETETLEEAKARILRELNKAYSDEIEPLVTEYPEVETKTWPIQEKEAKQYLNWLEVGGTQPSTPMLDNILAGRNEDGGTETLEQLSQAVLANADLFIQVQTLTGRRQRLAKNIENATTKDEVYLVNWVTS